MNKLCLLFCALFFILNNAISQQNVAVTLILPQNYFDYFINSQNTGSVINYKISGLDNIQKDLFNQNLKSVDGFENSVISESTKNGIYSGKITLSANKNFDDIKTVLQQAGISYVMFEEEVMAIEKWSSLSQDNCKKLKQLNENINNIIAKREWVLNNPTEKAKAEQNGWVEQSNIMLINAENAKKEFLKSIK